MRGHRFRLVHLLPLGEVLPPALALEGLRRRPDPRLHLLGRRRSVGAEDDVLRVHESADHRRLHVAEQQAVAGRSLGEPPRKAGHERLHGEPAHRPLVVRRLQLPWPWTRRLEHLLAHACLPHQPNRARDPPGTHRAPHSESLVGQGTLQAVQAVFPWCSHDRANSADPASIGLGVHQWPLTNDRSQTGSTQRSSNRLPESAARMVLPWQTGRSTRIPVRTHTEFGALLASRMRQINASFSPGEWSGCRVDDLAGTSTARSPTAVAAPIRQHIDHSCAPRLPIIDCSGGAENLAPALHERVGVSVSG